MEKNHVVGTVLVLFVALLLSQHVLADIVEYNRSNQTQYNESNIPVVPERNDSLDNASGFEFPHIDLPEINTTDLDKKFANATKTGIEPIDQTTEFLANASPFLLLIVGILLVVLSGFGKIIGLILVLLAAIRLIQMLFF